MLACAASGRPEIALITGEAGIGKSRLLREFCRRAVRAGGLVCSGSGHQDQPIPYRSLVEALRRHEGALLEAAEERELLTTFLHRRSIQPPSRSDAASEQLRLFLGVSSALLRLAGRQLVVVAVDDAHWLDTSSLDLLEHLVFSAVEAEQPTQILFGLCHRAPDPGTRVSRVLSRIRREEACHVLRLEGFGGGETSELMQGLGIPRPAHQLISTVWEATRGNPLFVAELVRHLRRRDALELRAGFVATSAKQADLQLPDDVTSSIAARAQLLSPAAQRALRVAAVIGERFELTTLAGLLGMVESELEAAIEDATQADFLKSEGEELLFSHPVVRQVFHSGSSVPSRRRVHAKVAAELSNRPGADSGFRALRIAHHLLGAGPLADPREVLRWTRRASTEAARVCAWGEAARFYAAAAEVDDPAIAPSERAELHYLAGYHYHRDWDPGPCVYHYRTALAFYEELGDVSGIVGVLKDKVRAAMNFTLPEDDAEREAEQLRRSLDALGTVDPALRARGLDALANHHWAARRVAEADKLAEQALRIGRDNGDPLVCSEIAGIAALVALSRLMPERARDAWERGAEHARQAGDLHREAQAAFRMPLAELLGGRLDAADARARQARELNARVHNWGEFSLSCAIEASLAVARGRPALAESTAGQAIRMIRRSGYPWALPLALGALACGRALRGDWSAAGDALDLLLDPEGQFDAPRRHRRLSTSLRGLVDALSAGEPAPDSLSPLTPPTGEFDTALIPLLCAQVDQAFLLDRPELAQGVAAALELACERGVVLTSGWLFFVPRVLGVARALEGRRELAREILERGLEQARSIGARGEHARTALDLAHLIGPGDRSAAARAHALACEELDELRLDGLRPRATAIADQLGLDPPRVPSEAEREGPLSHEELQLLDRIANGREEREIAEDLLLLPTAAAVRTEALLRRIGATSRTAAAAWAASETRGRGAERIRHALARYGAIGDPVVLAVTDIEGSTALMERIGDHAAVKVLQEHNRIVRSCLSSNGGTEIQHTGDGFIIAFRSAPDALACAASVQRQITQRNDSADEPLRIRIGIHAGAALPDEDRLVGVAVNTTASICATARPGEILVSDAARSLAPGATAQLSRRDPISLKGSSTPVALYSLAW
jgi:class 3 adenylate cyclase